MDNWEQMWEIVKDHMDDEIKGGYWYCTECGYDYGVFGADNEATVGHALDLLDKAGFGKLPEEQTTKT